MNMTLSKRGDYVMRAAISLARAEAGSYRKIRQIVADTEVPQTFASQILADLVRAGLATSKAGRDGGYRLDRPPSEISVLQVVEAAEGPLRSERCALGEGPCRWDAVCPVHETWTQAAAMLRELLSRTTLDDIAERDAAIEAGTYAVPPDAHRSHAVAVGVSDVVQVELAEGAVHLALARVAGVLGALVRNAIEDGVPDLDEGPSTTTSRRRTTSVVEASLVAPSGKTVARRSKKASKPAPYVLAWKIASLKSDSHLEADLVVIPFDAERCELRVAGSWHLSVAGTDVSTRELERQSRRTVRAFLRHLARALEG